jgi:hypothetical protein
MASVVIKLGKDAVILRNTNTYASPSWTAITNVTDVTLTMEKSEEDVSTRGSGGWDLSVFPSKSASVEFQMNHDPADTDWIALHASFISDTAIELLVLNGPNSTGSQGLRATMQVGKFNKGQPLKGAQRDDVMAKPTVSANAPAWVTI